MLCPIYRKTNMIYKLFVFIFVLVESASLIRGGQIVSSDRRINTISKFDFDTYGREKTSYFRIINHIFNRVPKGFLTKKETTRVRLPRLNTIQSPYRASNVHNTPAARSVQTGHIPSRHISRKHNRFQRKRFRPNEYTELGNLRSRLGKVKTGTTLNHKGRFRKKYILRNKYQPKVAGQKLNLPMISLDKSKITKDKSILPQETKVVISSIQSAVEIVTPSSKPIRTIIPPLISYRNKSTRKKANRKVRRIMKAQQKSKPKISAILMTREITTPPLVKSNPEKQNSTSFITLLNSRRPEIQNETDKKIIKKHLVTLDAMRDEDPNKNIVLIKQMEYVKKIAEFNVQREVLKLLVKDIIEKSGVMESSMKRADVETLTNLIKIVNKITAEFVNHNTSKVNNVKEPKVSSTTKSSVDQIKHGQNVGSRITNSLGGFKPIDASDGDAHNGKLNSKLNDFEKHKRTIPTIQGAPTPSDSVPIIGNTNQNITTLEIVQLDTKRVDEPVGGDLGYWTHLSAGLADMLCNLCRKQTQDECIKIACTDDRSLTTTSTTTSRK